MRRSAQVRPEKPPGRIAVARDRRRHLPDPQGVYRLEIACGDDWPGLIAEAAKAISGVLPRLPVGRAQKIGCTVVNAYSKHWPCLFPQHGPGTKHRRRIELADWEQEIVNLHTEAFVHGLIHSDGCRTINRVRRVRIPEVPLHHESADIKGLLAAALGRLEIPWRRMNRKTISIARREAVARLDEFVGPKY